VLVAEIPDKKDAEAFRAAARTEANRADARGWDPGLLYRARKELAEYIGPMAKFIVDRASGEARNRKELLEALAAEIRSAKDRELFLAALVLPP
jgi:hypothetical protein